MRIPRSVAHKCSLLEWLNWGLFKDFRIFFILLKENRPYKRACKHISSNKRTKNQNKKINILKLSSIKESEGNKSDTLSFFRASVNFVVVQSIQAFTSKLRIRQQKLRFMRTKTYRHTRAHKHFYSKYNFVLACLLYYSILYDVFVYDAIYIYSKQYIFAVRETDLSSVFMFCLFLTE